MKTPMNGAVCPMNGYNFSDRLINIPIHAELEAALLLPNAGQLLKPPAKSSLKWESPTV